MECPAADRRRPQILVWGALLRGAVFSVSIMHILAGILVFVDSRISDALLAYSPYVPPATEQPDRIIPGTTSIHIPILDSLTSGITREEEADRSAFEEFLLKPEEARAFMCGMYRALTNDYAASGLS